MSAGVVRDLRLLADDRERALLRSLSWLAAVAVGARLLVSVVVNAPTTPSRAPVPLLATVGTGLAALALIVAGIRTDRPAGGVGLLFAGVFGGLATLSPAAVVPSAVAVTAGTALFALTHRVRRAAPLAVVTGALVATLAIGLGSAVAGAAALRLYASPLAFLSLAGTPAFVTTDRRSLVRAGLAFAVVVAVGLSLPFVTGAITLVGTGGVGASLPVIAVGVAGAVTTASAALRERRWLLLAGVALLGAAGVPATLDRAVPFALGVVALISQEGTE
jgi:hypothetical protein